MDAEEKVQRVKFTKSHEGYNAGEYAGFTPEAAAKLVEKGVAELTDAEGPAAPTTEEDFVPAEEEGRGRRRRAAEE